MLDGILDKSPNPLLLILDCVQDPHNLGACLLYTSSGGTVSARITWVFPFFLKSMGSGALWP